MTKYTILSRRKKDGRWEWIGTCDEGMMEQETVASESVEVKLPKTFLCGAVVRAKMEQYFHMELFYIPSNRDAVVRR